MVKKLFFFVLGVLIASLFCRVLLCDRFKVKGYSMEPTLHDADWLWVEKWTLGGRIYTRYDFSSGSLSCFRFPGFGILVPGDILVFNVPNLDSLGKIKFKMNHVYAKRCVGAPGDIIEINNGYYYNKSVPDSPICPLARQRILSGLSNDVMDSLKMDWNNLLGTEWTIKNFGPMKVPGKGDTLVIDSVAVSVYSSVVEYEIGRFPEIGEKYVFDSNWYFMGGDNVLNSYDSRFFGFVPEDFIIGRAIHKEVLIDKE